MHVLKLALTCALVLAVALTSLAVAAGHRLSSIAHRQRAIGYVGRLCCLQAAPAGWHRAV